MIHGIDISNYQGDIDFNVLKRKIGFLFMRAAKGKVMDARLQRNVNEARRVGIPYGLYFVVKPAYSWAEQARIHADLWNEYKGELSPVMDFEDNGGLNKTNLLSWLTKYLEGGRNDLGFEDLTGDHMVIYTSAHYMSMVELSGSNGLWRRPLWVASWNVSKPTIPDEWKNHGQPWLFWQYSAEKNNKAAEYGAPPPPYADPDIDLDWFNGDAANFKAVYGVMPNNYEIIQPPDDVIPEWVVVTGNGVNIRNKPVITDGSQVGKVKKGARLPVIGEDGDFWRVELYVSKDWTKPE